MKIVHVLNSLTIGGLEKVVVDICNNIDSNSNQVYIITLSNKDLKLKSELNENIELISLPFRNDSMVNIVFFWLFGLPKMVKILNRLKPQVVHSHLYFHYFLFLSLSLKFARISPTHCRTIHTSGLFYASRTVLNRFRLLIEKIGMRIYPTNLISISKQIQENNISFFLKIAKNIKMIPNGIDLKKFSKLNFLNKKSDFNFDQDIVIITYVSRLDYGKNHEVLLKAIAEVVKKCQGINLCLVGDGVLKETLVKQAEKLNVTEYITFFGNVNNVAEILSITDIGVFPSQFEGFGISLIEKMAMQLPVIVSDINVFKEIVTHEENGIFYNVNDFNGLSQSILMLINDDRKRLNLGKNALKTALKYDIQQVTKDTIIFYEETLSV